MAAVEEERGKETKTARIAIVDGRMIRSMSSRT